MCSGIDIVFMCVYVYWFDVFRYYCILLLLFMTFELLEYDVSLNIMLYSV